jgi:hypothetical protein
MTTTTTSHRTAANFLRTMDTSSLSSWYRADSAVELSSSSSHSQQTSENNKSKSDDVKSRGGSAERIKREVWEVFFGPTASTGDCPVCGSPVTWKRWQAGHMRAASRGGGFIPSNLVVSCGCNQEMSVTHVLDYMGLHAAHRVSRLHALVTKLFFSQVPKPTRRKLIAVHEGQVLVRFVSDYYNPPKLKAYQEWLEVDADDLLRLASHEQQPSKTLDSETSL